MQKSFVKIESGNFQALVLTDNLAKREALLSKVKPPKWGQAFTDQRNFKREFPVYKSGMSTAEYVRQYEKRNRMKMPTGGSSDDATGLYINLNENPATEYDATIPLLVIDENPDFDPAEMPAPKAKPARVSKQAARIAALELALRCMLEVFGQDDGLPPYECVKAARAALDIK